MAKLVFQEQVGATVRFAQKKIWLGGVITNANEADELIDAIKALRPFLSDPISKPEDTGRSALNEEAGK